MTEIKLREVYEQVGVQFTHSAILGELDPTMKRHVYYASAIFRPEQPVFERVVWVRGNEFAKLLAEWNRIGGSNWKYWS